MNVLLLIIMSFVPLICGYNILGIFTHNGRSHHILFSSLVEELAARNHNVTVINNFPLKEFPNLRRIPIKTENIEDDIINMEKWSDKFIYDTSSFNDFYRAYSTTIRLKAISEDNCKTIMRNNEIKELITSRVKYDLVIVEQFVTDCDLAIAYKLNAPTVGITTHVLMTWAYSRVGAPNNPAFVPNRVIPTGSNPNLWQKMKSAIINTYINVHYTYAIQRNEQAIVNEIYPDVPHLESLGRNMCLVLLNQYFPLTGSRLYGANVIEIGGMHVKEVEIVDKELMDFLDNGRDGVVYISFGTVASNLPSSILTEISAFIENSNLHFVWKVDNIQNNVTKNLLIKKWVPQPSVLCHPNVVAFVTHSGMLSTTEAMHCGVPVIAVPIFGDQFANAESAVESGLGVVVDIYNLNRNVLKKALQTILQDSAVNKKGEGKIRLFYSTPACYLKAVHAANPSLPVKQDDFLPVAYDQQSHFSGLFTSRPALKLMAREGHVFLQMAKQLQVLAQLPDNSKLFEEFNWIMGVFQDHNIISGALRPYVKDYYTSKMYIAVQRSTLLLRQAFNKIRRAPPATVYYRCSFNISSCSVTKGDKYFILLYNPLSWPVTVPVRLPIKSPSQYKYTIFNPSHKKVKTAILKIPDAVLNIPNRQKVLDHELVFMSQNIPALGYRSYYIEKSYKSINKRSIIKKLNKIKSRKKQFWKANNIDIKDDPLLDEGDSNHDYNTLKSDTKIVKRPPNKLNIEDKILLTDATYAYKISGNKNLRTPTHEVIKNESVDADLKSDNYKLSDKNNVQIKDYNDQNYEYKVYKKKPTSYQRTSKKIKVDDKPYFKDVSILTDKNWGKVASPKIFDQYNVIGQNKVKTVDKSLEVNQNYENNVNNVPDQKSLIVPMNNINVNNELLVENAYLIYDDKIYEKKNQIRPTQKTWIIDSYNNNQMSDKKHLIRNDINNKYELHEKGADLNHHYKIPKAKYLIMPAVNIEIENKTLPEDVDSNYNTSNDIKQSEKDQRKPTNYVVLSDEILVDDVDLNYDDKIFDKKYLFKPIDKVNKERESLLDDVDLNYDYKISDKTYLKMPINNVKTIEELIDDVERKYNFKMSNNEFLTKPKINVKTKDEPLFENSVDQSYDYNILDKKNKVKSIEELIDDVENKYNFKKYVDKYLTGRRKYTKFENKIPEHVMDPSGDYTDYDDYTIQSKLAFKNANAVSIDKNTPTPKPIATEADLKPKPIVSEYIKAAEFTPKTSVTDISLASEYTEDPKDMSKLTVTEKILPLEAKKEHHNKFYPIVTNTMETSQNNEDSELRSKPMVTEVAETSVAAERSHFAQNYIFVDIAQASEDTMELNVIPKSSASNVTLSSENTEEPEPWSAEIMKSADYTKESLFGSNKMVTETIQSFKAIEDSDLKFKHTNTNIRQASEDAKEPELRPIIMEAQEDTKYLTPKSIVTDISQAKDIDIEMFDFKPKSKTTKTNQASKVIENSDFRPTVTNIALVSEATVPELMFMPIISDITHANDVFKPRRTSKPEATEEIDFKDKPTVYEFTQAYDAIQKPKHRFILERTLNLEVAADPNTTIVYNDNKKESATITSITTEKEMATTYNIYNEDKKESVTRTSAAATIEEATVASEKIIKENELYVLSNDRFISNEYINITLDSTKQIAGVTLSNGVKLSLNIQMLYYTSDDPIKMRRNNKSPGAYIFRPMDPTPEQIKDFIKVEVLKTEIVEELHSTFADYAGFALKLYTKQPVIEVDWVVGPIPINDDLGKDVFIRYETDLVNNGVFYTDSNGRQTIKRIRTRRSDYEPVSARAISGNFYPVTSKIYIEDLDKNIRFSIFNDRAQGGSSLNQGQIDMMVHRRILTDDSGAETYLNDTENGKGIVVRGKHYLYISKRSHKPHKIFEKKFAKEVELAPQILISQNDPHSNRTREVWFQSRNEFSAMNKRLPVGIHLLTLQQWNDDTLLIRLENYLEKADTIKDGVKFVFMKYVFANMRIIKMVETTLDGNKWLKDWVPLQWRKKEQFYKSFNDAYGGNGTAERCRDEALKPLDEVNINAGIQLIPQQIRTFVVWIYNVTT